MFNDPDFWQKWIDRWTELRRGTLTTNHLYAIMDNLGNQLTNAAAREAKRWNNTGWDYQREISTLKNWTANRLHFIDTNLLCAPVFSHQGGTINSNFTLTIMASTLESHSTI